MRGVEYCFYVSGDYDSVISRLIGRIGYIANKADCLKYLGKKVLVSHEEIRFCDRGICFSSATRGKKTGVRFAPSSEVLKHKERWITIVVELPDEVEQAMWDAAKSIKGKGYDYIGVLFKLTPFSMLQSWKRWYCSEACNWISYKAYLRWFNMRLYYVHLDDKFQQFVACFSEHRKLSPLANLLMMIGAGYKMEAKQ